VGACCGSCCAAQRREGAPAAAAAPQRARRAQITRARARKPRIVTTTGHTGSPAHHEQGGRRRREAKKSGPRLSSFRCLRVACAVPAFLLRCRNSTRKASNGRPQGHSSGRGVTGCDRPPFARERSARTAIEPVHRVEHEFGASMGASPSRLDRPATQAGAHLGSAKGNDFCAP